MSEWDWYRYNPISIQIAAWPTSIPVLDQAFVPEFDHPNLFNEISLYLLSAARTENCQIKQLNYLTATASFPEEL